MNTQFYKQFLITICTLLFFLINSKAQTLSTTGSYLNNNGSGTVTFNLTNTNTYPIAITDIRGITGTTGAVTVQMYFNTTPISGAPSAFTVVNGWNLVSSASITGIANTTTLTTQPFLTGMSFVIPASTTYGIAIFATGQRYHTLVGTSVLSFTVGGLTMTTGPTIGYGGGTPPTAPTIASRGWLGDIVFAPQLSCSGTPTAGNATASTSVACASNPFTLSLVNDSIRTGLSYQWLKSSTGIGGSYAPILNDTNRTNNESQTSTSWYRCLVTCLSASSDTSTPIRVSTPTLPFSGTYTVNSLLPASTTNYQSLSQLVSELNCMGVTGPVTINLDTANYNETYVFGTINGSSAVNTITINGRRRTISNSASPIVRFNGTKYVTLDSLNIIGTGSFAGFGIHIGGGSQYLTIKNCTVDVGTTSTATTNAGIVISGSISGATTAGNNAQYITISNNTVIGGYYGLTMMGNAGYLDNYGHSIVNNTFRDFYFYGTFFTNADSVNVIGNDINRATRSTLSTFYGIYLATSRNMKIGNNRIRDAGTGTYTAYPIYLVNCVNSPGFETVFYNNLIYNINTTGIFYGIYSLTTALTGVQFFHNTIHHNVSASTGAIRGAFFSVAPTNVIFRNNIVCLRGNGTGIKTNIYLTTTSTTFTSNNNVLFNDATGGTNLIGFWAGNNISLPDWTTASGQDLNSTAANPILANPSAGLLNQTNSVVDNLGVPVGVLSDINGISRSLITPDAGAYEVTSLTCSGTPIAGRSSADVGYIASGSPFNLTLQNDTVRNGLTYQWLKSTTGASGPYSIIPNDTTRSVSETQTTTSWYRCRVGCISSFDTSVAVMVITTITPLPAGTYTINSTLPYSATNHQTLVNMVAELNAVGVSGPVVINLDSANYNQDLLFGNIPGTSAINTITINGRRRTITSVNSPIIRFNGTKYLVLDSINIVGAGAFAGFGIHIGGGAQYLTIKNSTIDVGATSTATTNAGIVVSGSTSVATTVGNNAQYLTIQNNTVIGGYYSLTMIGNTSYLNNAGHVIRNNRFRDFYLYGAYLVNADSGLFEGNDINRATRASLSTFYGIYMATSRNLNIRNNKIRDAGTGTYTAYPIYLSNCVNLTGFETVFSNNLIYNINTTGTFYGIYSLTTTLKGVKFYHNTINHLVTLSTGVIRGVFFSVVLDSIDFRNNIISLGGSGTGVKTNIYVSTPSTTFTSNNNVLFNGATGGTNVIGFWTANQITLANWQTATGLLDAASVSFDPVFSNPSAGLLNPLSGNVDNIGVPLGITTDVEGTTRSLTAPDAGGYEFTGLAADISMEAARLVRSSNCYSANDTIFLTIKNIFGTTVDFSVTPHTVVYSVLGPINTTDSIVINSGTLTLGNSVSVFATNINASIPGLYTSSRAFVRPTLANTSLANDTLRNSSTMDVKRILSVSPKTRTIAALTDSLELTASSPIFPSGEVKFTEVCHWKLATGATPVAGWPAYLVADDYLELAGVPSTDLAGYTLEEWTGTTLQHSVTFPTGTLFSPVGTLILATGQLGTSVPSPVNFYYHTGNTVTHSSTGDIRGYIIKNSTGVIIDVTTYGAYVFPVASGVTTADWTGSTPIVSSAGNRLSSPDINSGSNWVNENATNRQDPNILNLGFPLPLPSTLTGFNWLYLGSSIGTNPKIKLGPYTTPGTYTYIARYNTVCGFFYDTAVITVSAPIPVTLLSFDASKNGNDVQLKWTTATEINNDFFTVEYSVNGTDFTEVGKVNAKGNSAIQTSYSLKHSGIFNPNNGLKALYYRLKQTDEDGAYSYSSIELVTNETENANDGIQVSPNPSNGSMRLSMLTEEPLSSTTIVLVNEIGTEVWSQEINSTDKTLNIDLDIILPDGLYVFIVKGKSTIISKKVMIQQP